MERISKNFVMTEFSVSAKAAAAGIANDIPEGVKPAVRALVLNLLQPVCDATGWRCRINSGYRSAVVNKLVGGAVTSQHTRGEAADCVFVQNGVAVPPITVMREVIRLGLDFDQMIAYPSMVHLSHTTAKANRREVLYSGLYNGARL